MPYLRSLSLVFYDLRQNSDDKEYIKLKTPDINAIKLTTIS